MTATRPGTRLARRAIVRLSASDENENVAEFLQGLVTNDVIGNGIGHLPVYAGLLSPQGKTLFDFLVWRAADPAGDDLLIDCEAEFADELAKRLSLYRLRRKIGIARDDTLAVHWSKDGDAPEGSLADPRLAALGHRWLAPSDDSADDSALADDAWTAHRLSLGVPEGRAELGDILWLETNAAELNGVSFAKGCYIGQENTARMNWRSKVNRRLLVRPLDQSDEKRRKHSWPELGYAVDHVRVDAVAAEFWPEWVGAGKQVSE